MTVTDQNVGDKLAYRWVIDYPPWTTDTHPAGSGDIQASADGTQQQVTKFLGMSPCAFNPTSTVAVHRLEFILTDGAFDQLNPMVFDALAQGSDGFVVRANWTFSCP